MARNPKLYTQSKKHQARLERERRLNRLIITGSLIAIALVILIVGYGLLDQFVLSNLRPVAVVNGERITNREWQTFVRFSRQHLINQMIATVQDYQLFAQVYGDDPSFASFYSSRLTQLEQQLSPSSVGQQALDTLIEAKLLEQEARKRNLTISEEEVDRLIEETFGYYRNGTPTPSPTLPQIATSTLSPTQLALISPTPTSTQTPTPSLTPTPLSTATPIATLTQANTTPSPTSTPTLPLEPTPTPYTYESFLADYREVLKSYEAIQVSEEDIRRIVRNQLLSQKMEEVVLAELGVAPEQEMIWARHILVEDEAKAQEVLAKLKAGEDWTKLAAEYSTDTSNKDSGGDLGWFYRGVMVPEFENAAFALKEIGEVSQPIKTQFGFHVIQLLGRETRRLSEVEWERYREEQFQKWLSELRATAKIEIDESWPNRVPSIPAIPQEVRRAIDALSSTQFQPVPQPTIAETTPLVTATP